MVAVILCPIFVQFENIHKIMDTYWLTQKLPPIYTANHATFPIHIRKITVQICGNLWVTQYNVGHPNPPIFLQFHSNTRIQWDQREFKSQRGKQFTIIGVNMLTPRTVIWNYNALCNGPLKLKFSITSNAFCSPSKLIFVYRCPTCLPISVI